MRRMRKLAVVLLLMLGAAGVRAGEVIDRIVATVGKHAILESDLDEAVRFEMFAAGRPLASVTNEDVNSALNRLVDQRLIHDDIGAAEPFAPSPNDVNKRISELRGGATDEAWRSLLMEYGLTGTLVGDRVRMQLETMRMVNQRLRPSVRVDEAEIEAAYRNEFVPKLKQTGAKEPALAEVSSGIRAILVERHIGELMEAWLESLRGQTEIRVRLDEGPSAASKTSETKAESVSSGDPAHE